MGQSVIVTENIGTRIQMLLGERGQTQQQLAEALGIKRSTIKNWCLLGISPSGEGRHLKADDVILLCKYFDCSADYILGLDGKKVKNNTLDDVIGRNDVKNTMSRLEKLKEMERRLYSAMEDADGRTLPALARQYRETIKEIEEIEGGERGNDEIGEILAKRGANGEPIPNRKNRTAVSKQRRT